jgi:hypothetical protein
VPSERRPGLPSGLDDVVRRCLAVDPGARFARAAELGVAAERALSTPPARPPESTPRPRRQKRALLLAGGALLAAVAGCTVLITGTFSAQPLPYAQGGRGLPAPASLEPCGNQPVGRSVVCRNPTNRDGVMEIGFQGSTIRMSTMDVDVTRVTLASALPVHPTGGEVTAPPSAQFIVIDLTVTNVTRAAREFEPSEDIDGRLTMLMLLSAQHGNVLNYNAPRWTDYSAQYSPAFAGLQHPLYQAVLPPGRPIRGQLVFDYPNAELREAKHALLEMKELREPFSSSRSEAMISLPL